MVFETSETNLFKQELQLAENKLYNMKWVAVYATRKIIVSFEKMGIFTI